MILLKIVDMSNKEIADLLHTNEEFIAYVRSSGIFLTSGVASQLIGVVPETLRKWHDKGTLVPERVLGSGHRRYSLQQIVDYVIEHKK